MHEMCQSLGVLYIAETGDQWQYTVNWDLMPCTVVHNAMKNVQAQLEKGERVKVKDIFHPTAYSPGQNQQQDFDSLIDIFLPS